MTIILNLRLLIVQKGQNPQAGGRFGWDLFIEKIGGELIYQFINYSIVIIEYTRHAAQ